MPPRKTTDFGALFEALIEDLKVQVAASVDRSLSDYGRRLARIERRLNLLDESNTPVTTAEARRNCTLCERESIARGLCSAHYQQWRYRERRQKTEPRVNLPVPQNAVELVVQMPDVSIDN